MSYRIREARKAKGFTLEELGNLIGKKKNTVSRYENELIEPNLDTWKRLAEALNTTTEYLQGSDIDLRATATVDAEQIKKLAECQQQLTKLFDNGKMEKEEFVARTGEVQRTIHTAAEHTLSSLENAYPIASIPDTDEKEILQD